MHQNDPLRVVVAGGGVAGLETLVALNALAGDRVSVTLVAPDDAFTLRALDVFEPFGLGRPKRYPLAELTAGLGVALAPERVARVDRARRRVVLGGGGELPYDALVVAVGAIPYPAFDHGVVFDRARSPEPFDALLSDVQAGRGSVAVVVPAGTTWALPAYELAIMLRSFGGAGRAAKPVVTLVTAEREPLQAFGAPAGAMIRDELHAAGVDLVCGVAATVRSDRLVHLGHGRDLHAARVVHLPLLAGPRLAGLPYDPAGFLLRDDGDLTVDGDDSVFAIGDGAAGAFKQGGLAAQQADAVAERIAFAAGAGERPPRPYAPTLRGLLRTENGPRYLRAEPPGGEGECLVSDQCLWWPPSKVASRWLTPWLAARDAEARMGAPRVLPGGGISRGSLAAAS